MQTSCAEFEETVKSNFTFLFRDKGFELIHRDVSSPSRCLLVLESKSFRVKFYYAVDEINVLLGTIAAPLMWDDKEDDTTLWFYLRSITAFIENDMEQGFPDAKSRIEKTHEFQMQEQKEVFIKHFSEIESLFSVDNLNGRQHEYDLFLEQRHKILRKKIEERSHLDN